MVTLLFELLDDEDALRRQAQLFVETHRIPWQVIPVHGEITPYWNIVPHVQTWPRSTCRSCCSSTRTNHPRRHTGFPGPDSGRLYQAMVERYQRVAAELVAEK